jgi:pimeloyl-ACP methyl ester carboxylesterase
MIEGGLPFISLNPDAPKTIIFLHGIYGSHNVFHLHFNSSHLQAYHLLIPDLPQHGLSREVPLSTSSQRIPLTLPAISDALASLIRARTKTGTAHIVGSDMGGYIALHLASSHPSLVSSVFVTGCERDYSSKLYAYWVAIKTYLGSFLGLRLLPRSWLLSLTARLDAQFTPELTQDLEKASTWPTTIEVFKMLNRDYGNGKEICENVRARTCLVAAGRQDDVELARLRGGWLRTDPVEETEEYDKVWRGSVAALVRGARHAWDLQVAKLDVFDVGVKSWIEGLQLPNGYEVLENALKDV